MTVVYAVGIGTAADGSDESNYTDLATPDTQLTSAGFVPTGVVTAGGFAIWCRNGNLGTAVQPTPAQQAAINRSLDRVVRGAKPGLWTLADITAWYQGHPNAVVFAAHV